MSERRHTLTTKATAGNIDTIEKGLEQVRLWESANSMEFSYHKTKLMHLSCKRGFPLDHSVPSRDYVIEPTNKVRILGVWLDSCLTWKHHIAEAAQRASYRLNSLKPMCKMFWGATRMTMRHFYVRAVLPALTHATFAWCNVTGERLQKLAKVHRRARLLITLFSNV